MVMTNDMTWKKLLHVHLFLCPHSSGRGTSSTIVPMWRWLVVQRKQPLSGSLYARNPKRCSSPETSTTCAPTATSTRSRQSPHTVPPIRRSSARSPSEEAPAIIQAAPSSSCSCCICCPCFGYNRHNTTRQAWIDVNFVFFPLDHRLSPDFSSALWGVDSF